MNLRLRRNVPLAPLATFGIGGRARYFVSVSNATELVEAVGLAKDKKWPYFLIAGGSNVVFGDGTFRGLAIHFVPKVSPCRWQGLTLTCPANLPLSQLIRTAISHNLAGLETLSGIPGTVGGAIIGNAGAYGQTISEHLIRVEIFDPDPNVRHRMSNILSKIQPSGIRWLSKKQCRFAYRESIFKSSEWLILKAEFKLSQGDKKKLAAKSREIIRIRSEKYDPKLRCPGSFFKNVLAEEVSQKSLKLIPPGKIIEGKIPAGYLLERVGARGMRFGDLRVADHHGNLLVNDGAATYREVRMLAAKLKKLVKAKFHITLDEEVRYFET
ncbi:MAG: UDP-N-acetylmuramate dehydrogenase [Candidatus Vogelbacteria bacterium]|nr:UDP-N-acetylmuramate dehydrogenase [Candidatus Vogelbacteria bacterium]